MSKNYDQSKKAKAEFIKSSPLAIYMRGDYTKIFTREELMEVLSVNGERQMREQLSKLANYFPVVATSDRKGYQLLEITDENNIEQLTEISELAQHQINELQCRIDNLKARMKPLVAIQKVIEKKLEPKEA